MPNAAETVAHTTSRHTGPRAWLRALGRSIKADLIEGATATTVVVYEDLARRMDYSTGHVRYCLAEVMERTGLSRTAITDHIRLLRRAGWLAWVEHGSLRNALRSLGLPGYARTATVYAATIPPAYDTWRGHVLDGTGYAARVVGFTATGREQAIAAAQSASRTPSLEVVKGEGQVQVVGGCSATASRAARKAPRTTILGRRVTRRIAEAAERVARYVRPLVNWLQTATIRQLSWVLLDLVARGWDEQRILVWLREIARHNRDGQQWRPDRPHRFLAAALRLDAYLEAEAALRATTVETAPAGPNAYFTQASADLNDRLCGADPASQAPGSDAGLTLEDLDRETRAEMIQAAAAAWAYYGDDSLIVSAVHGFGPEGARRLYGDLVDRVLQTRYNGVEAAGAR